MFKTSKTARLREAQYDARAAARLGRLFAVGLARWAFESVDVRRRLRLSRRQVRAVELGAVAAVGLTAAGVIAKRANKSPDAPTPVT
jgi:hypothetical protein